MERLKTFSGLKAGTRIRVVANSNYHNYVIGRTYVLSTDGYGYDMSDVEGDGRHNFLCASDCVFATTTVDELRQSLVDLQKRLVDLQKRYEEQST